MTILPIRAPNARQELFRVAYVSRAAPDFAHSGVMTLAGDAARANARREVSGVLVESDGRFLQWLEGPVHRVCGVMARIAEDPRHTDITVLNADWGHHRRFAHWPMQLAERPSVEAALEASRAVGRIDGDTAHSVFACLAELHDRTTGADAPRRAAISRFAKRLINADPQAIARFPELGSPCLYARASVVDEVCAAFGRGWREDTLTRGDILIGLTYLGQYWRAAGAVADPVYSTQRIGLVAPPGASELIGAIVKADLFRSAGIGVDLVIEADDRAALDALAAVRIDEIVVAGPRVGLNDDLARAQAFSELARKRFPSMPVHLGGRVAGPLVDASRRLASTWESAERLPQSSAEWLAMSTLAQLTRDRSGAVTAQ